MKISVCERGCGTTSQKAGSDIRTIRITALLGDREEILKNVLAATTDIAPAIEMCRTCRDSLYTVIGRLLKPCKLEISVSVPTVSDSPNRAKWGDCFTGYKRVATIFDGIHESVLRDMEGKIVATGTYESIRNLMYDLWGGQYRIVGEGLTHNEMLALAHEPGFRVQAKGPNPVLIPEYKAGQATSQTDHKEEK